MRVTRRVRLEQRRDEMISSDIANVYHGKYNAVRDDDERRKT
jgi:hypothetical protein